MRFEVKIDPQHDNIDNTSPKNIEALEKYAAQLIHEKEKILGRIAKIIDN